MNNIVRFLIISIFVYILQFQTALADNSVAAPVMGSVSSGYGVRVDPFTGKMKFHDGIDISAPYGTPIYAMQDGTVIHSGLKGGYGLSIMIDSYYPDIPAIPRIVTLYGHTAVAFVNNGDKVKRGQVIALVGSTGHSTGPHLHFEVRYKGSPVDPYDYLVKLPSYLNYVASVRSRTKYVSNNHKSKYNVYF